MSAKQKIINIVANDIDWNKVKERWKLHSATPNLFKSKTFQSYWRQNFYLRPGQALINLGLLQDKSTIWEDSVVLLIHECRNN